MPKRCIGEAEVVVRPTGTKLTQGWHGNPRCVYAGEIRVGKHRWPFKDLSIPAYGSSSGGTCRFEEAIDRAASEAVGFATSQTSDNRSEDDLPDWAPPAAVADAIERATAFAQKDSGEYRMRRGVCPRPGRR